MNTKLSYFLGIISGIGLMVIAWIAFSGSDNSSLAGMNLNTPQSQSQIQIQSETGMVDTDDIITKLNHIQQIINTHYIGDFDLDIAIEMMFQGFVYGALDPYTVYMSADTFARFMEDTEGEFIGVGISIAVDAADNRLTIISPIDGSPAFDAGVLPGDKILRVDGVEIFGEMLNEAVRMVRGELGTPVTLTLYRGGETFDLTIIREVIQVETVRSRIMNDSIGYIRISNFDRVTADQFAEAYNDLMRENIEGLIIDVRNNPGGLLSVVNSITDMLIPEGIIMFSEDARGQRQYARSTDGQIEIPLLVLVNGNSASASEVLSGAVRDTGVGEIIGTTTFGKGLVQNVFPLPDGSAVKVTVARYFTPAGISIHGDGITPDHYIEMPQELTNNLLRLDPSEDIQLQEALRIIDEKIKQQQ